MEAETELALFQKCIAYLTVKEDFSTCCTQSNFIFKRDFFIRSRSQSVELRQDFIMEAKRNYERTKQTQAQQVPSSGHVVMAVSGRRPSSDAAFPRRDFYGKPSVNLVSFSLRN